MALTPQEQQELDALNARSGAPAPAAAPAPTAAPASAAPAAPADPYANDQAQNDMINAETGYGAGLGMPAAAAADIGKGIVESPSAVLRGVSNAVAATGHGIADFLEGKTHTKADGTALHNPSINLPMEVGAKGLAWLGDKVSGLLPEPQTVTGHLVQDVTQFAVGIAGMGKLIELPAAASVAGKVGMKLLEGGLKNFGAAATVFQGQQQKISDIVEAHPSLRNPVTEFLASKPGDTEAEGRFKNGLEGVIAGGAADILFLGVKALKYASDARTANTAAAAEMARLSAVATTKELNSAIEAYHGSPHDFDTFDITKMGTGEGTQAFGHGHYVAENPEVARYYQNTVAKDKVPFTDDLKKALADQDNLGFSTRGEAVSNMLAHPDWADRWETSNGDLAKAFEDWKTQGGGRPATPTLYNVEVKAGKDQLLDWDKPITEQPPKVQEAVNKLMADHGIDLDPGLSPEFRASAKGTYPPNDTGGDFYYALSKKLGGEEAASKALHDAGIPGHRFLDGGSRANGEGTHNMVIYHDDSLAITAKNGEPLAPRPMADNAVHPAPYGTDLPMVPARDAQGAVLPGNTLADAAEVQKALNARWSVAGKEMAETQRFNPRTINAPEDLHAMVNATVAATEENLGKFIGGNADGVVTHKVTAAQAQAYISKMAPDLADISGQSESNLIINMAKDAATMQQLAARLHAYKQIMLSVVNDAGENASKALATEGTPEALTSGANALHSAHIAAQVLGMVKSIETNVARTMSAQRITKGLNSKLTEGWGYEQIAQKLEAGMQHADDKELLRNLASMKDNPKGFNKYLERTFGEKAAGAFNSWYMNSLLSSPKTHMANFLSNTASTLYQPLERAVAGVMPAQWGEVGPKLALRRFADEYTGMGLGLMDSFRAAREAFKLNRSILDPQGGTHIDTTGKSIDGLSARALGLSHDYYKPDGTLIRTDTTPVLSMFADGFSNTVGMPSRLLTSGDELFKQINYRGYLYSRATQSAREAGLTGKDFSDHVTAKMDEGFNSPGSNFPEGSATNKGGVQAAREATFTQPLDYGVSRWIQGMGNEPGFGGVMTKLVVPFVRTPVNLMRFTWRHTPILQNFETGFKRDLAAGGELRAKAQAQMVTGMGMSLAAGSLAYQGLITGGFSLNPEVRKAQEATGALEYAVKVGDKYYQYNRLDPVGTILGLHADFMQLTDHLSEFESNKLAYGMSLSLAKNLASKTYVQGLTNAMASIGDLMAGRSEIPFDTFAYRLSGALMVPAVVNAFKGDDSLREIRSMMDSALSRLPGSSQSVPPVHNVLGEVVKPPVGWGFDAFSPIGYGQQKHDPVYDEMARQMSQNEHPLNRIMPKLGDTNIDLREVTLKNGQNAYDRMQELLWKSGVKDRLQALFETPAWKDGSLKDAGPDYPGAPNTKISLTNKMIEMHKQIARQQLLAQNPELLQMYNQERTRMQMSGVTGEGPRVYIPPTFLQSILPEALKGVPAGARTKNDLK